VSPASLAAALLLLSAGPASPGEIAPRLAARVQRIVIHVLGGPAYDRPDRRFRYFSPPERSRWKASFGTHWIVWTDGSLWPRHPAADAPPSWLPDTGSAATIEDRRASRRGRARLRPPGHGNSDSVGIEVAHSGRVRDPFPDAQVRSLAWLLRTLLDLSGGRLTPADVFGHKYLDRRPAYARAACQRPGCPRFVDAEGHALRRRVDPPESLFAALAREGIAVPRPADSDADLRRAETLAPGVTPAVASGSGGR
jgi:hypothetical protein